MPDQSSFNLSTAKTGPVECLGQTFPSEEARREHYLKLLTAKLKEPAFRQIEGFPLGTDEAILALSDPPYYTACPNPWLGDFIKHYGTPYDSQKPYHREPFAADVSEGKNHPIYNAHSYHTKVPHRAIMKYILHYTLPGDVVYDGFCGTGMTGVAAQLCGDRAEVQALGYRIREDGTILDEEGRSISKLGARKAIINDLSPAATFIANNYNNPPSADDFREQSLRISRAIKEECGWMYTTIIGATEGEQKSICSTINQCTDLEKIRHLLGSTKNLKDTISSGNNKLELAKVHFFVISDVFACPECGSEIVYYDVAVADDDSKVSKGFKCPSCKKDLDRAGLERTYSNAFDPITKGNVRFKKTRLCTKSYTCSKGRFEDRTSDIDLAIESAITRLSQFTGSPLKLPDGSETQRNRDVGVEYAHQFYTSRNQVTLSYAQQIAHTYPPSMLAVTGVTYSTSRLYRWTPSYEGGGPLSGTLYMPSILRDISAIDALDRFFTKLPKVYETIASAKKGNTLLSTNSFRTEKPESLDYIFVDPPFGSNLFYSELSILWEFFLGVQTNNSFEAIEHPKIGKDVEHYRRMMLSSFTSAFKMLKPGRWMTVEFSNTKAAIWNILQSAIQEAGFVIANVSALDKQQSTFKSVTTTTAVKQDLVISAYKPNGGLEGRFAKNSDKLETAWDFIRTHLRNLPIYKAKGGQLEPVVERDPRILYDRMVAFYVGHSAPVPLSSGEFQSDLHEQFPVRDGMIFLPEQVHVYDHKRVQMESVGQLSIFVEDERSAIDWVRKFIKDRPSTQQDIHPDFTQQLNASWKKWEAQPELRLLLEQNFLCYNGVGEVPSQIHSYLSTQFKELRNLDKDHAQLRHKAKDRWYVPDPKKNIDVETLRNKRLLEEFWLYLPEGYVSAARNPDKAPTLPGMAAATPRPKVPRSKKLREVRTEAIRVGFKYCYQSKDYYTILAVADMLPESVLNEDEQLQMLYDNAALRSGTSTS